MYFVILSDFLIKNLHNKGSVIVKPIAGRNDFSFPKLKNTLKISSVLTLEKG